MLQATAVVNGELSHGTRPNRDHYVQIRTKTMDFTLFSAENVPTTTRSMMSNVLAFTTEPGMYDMDLKLFFYGTKREKAANLLVLVL